MQINIFIYFHVYISSCNFWVFGVRSSRLDVEETEMVLLTCEDHAHFPANHFEREPSWVASTKLLCIFVGWTNYIN